MKHTVSRCAVLLLVIFSNASAGIARRSILSGYDHASAQTDDYLQLVDAYASGDPDEVLRRLDGYSVSALDELLRDRNPKRSRTRPLTAHQLKAAGLLHGEAALRVAAESGALKIRAHIRTGSFFVQRLYAEGDTEFPRIWFVAAFRVLVNDVPEEALAQLSQARKLFPTDARIAVMTGATLENLASRLPHDNGIEAAEPCGPGEAVRCLAAAERILAEVVGRESANIEARLRLARVRQRLGRPTAEVELRQVRSTAAAPYATLATLFLAQMAAGAGRGAEARDLYRVAASSPTASSVAAMGLSAVHEREGQVDEAADVLMGLLLANPAQTDDDDVWMRYQAGQLDQSVPTLRQLRADLDK